MQDKYKSEIFASILSADLARLGEEVDTVLLAGADGIHFDVMDNHYVPNLTFGSGMCAALRAHCPDVWIDVHLMTNPVEGLIDQFAKAGANAITIHADATPNVTNSLDRIMAHNLAAGLAFNPDQDLTLLSEHLDKLSTVLIMSVFPGFAGQAFLPEVLPKIRLARRLIELSGRDIRLAVDGGINLDTIQDVAKAGASTYVAGSAIFGQPSYSEVVAALREKCG